LNTPEDLEIRFSKGANESRFERVDREGQEITGEVPKLVDDPTNGDPGLYEIWLAKR
jgi:hypothetical protein